MDTLEESIKHIIKVTEDHGDFVEDVDGYVYFWPERNTGSYAAWHLRVIADELDRRNAPWDAQINKYFDEQNKKELQPQLENSENEGMKSLDVVLEEVRTELIRLGNRTEEERDREFDELTNNWKNNSSINKPLC